METWKNYLKNNHKKDKQLKNGILQNTSAKVNTSCNHKPVPSVFCNPIASCSIIHSYTDACIFELASVRGKLETRNMYT